MPQTHFTVDFGGAASLRVEDIWPDGDAPENPTPEDVIAAMKSDQYVRSLPKLIEEWGIEDSLTAHVEGREVSFR